MPTLTHLENRIKNIESRNQRVELDKAWETSTARKTLLAVFTFIVIGVYMNYLQVSQPWLNALIPTAGFLLSTLTLSLFRKIWERQIFKRNS